MRAVVVGSGITGLFTAYYLRKGGHDVTMVEQNRSGPVTSVYNAGLITPSFSPAPHIGLARIASTVFGPRGPLYISPREVLKSAGWFLTAMREGVSAHESEIMEFGRASLGMYASFFRSEGIDADLVEGIVGLYLDSEQAGRASRQLGGRLVGEQEVREMGYAGFGGGVLAEDEFSINPGKLCGGLRQKVEEMGVGVLSGRRASIKASGNIGQVVLEGGESVSGDAVVACCGSMSREVLEPLKYNPQVLPARGLVRIYSTGGNQISKRPALLEDYGIGVVQHDPSTLRVTSFYEMTGFKDSFAESRTAWLEETVRKHLPGFGDAVLTTGGTGFRPCTPDQLPVIGKVPRFSNVYVATGNCRLGVTLAPATASLVRSMIEGSAPEQTGWRLFDPARFA